MCFSQLMWTLDPKFTVFDALVKHQQKHVLLDALDILTVLTDHWLTTVNRV